MNWRHETVKMGVPPEGDCGMRISDCGIKDKNRTDVVDEWLRIFSMTMFDPISESSQCISDRFSIFHYKSEVRTPKSEI